MEPVIRPAVLGPSRLEAAAVRALERAEEETAAALVALRAADDVVWTGAAARSYRGELERLTDAVRQAQTRLAGARCAVAAHAAAVADSGATTLAGAGPEGWTVP